MKDVYVFVGPTIPVEQAREILDATYLPPVKMGDVSNLERRRPAAIGIIDGLFEQVPSVWHKEILHALERGVRVFGASSMGALRAAELAPFGMEGVGAIFERLQSGELQDDDEVAVVHGAADAGYVQLSEAMVNLRDGLARCLSAGGITEQTHDRLVRAAKQTFYADRSWAAVRAAGRRAGVPEEELGRLMEFVSRERPNLKRDDAILLLRRMREEGERGFRPHVPSFRMEKTCFWADMVESVARAAPDPTGEAPGDEVTLDAIRDHVSALSPDHSGLRRGALTLLLVEREAERLGLRITQQRLQEVAARFRRARGLTSAKATEAWMEQNRIDKAEFTRMIALEALTDELVAHLGVGLKDALIRELRRASLFAPALEEVERKRRCLEEQGVQKPTMEDAGCDLAELLRWYAERSGELGGSLEELARARGFGSSRAFLSELLKQYIFERSTRRDGNEPDKEPKADRG